MTGRCLELERLVAHRELQLLRACARGNARKPSLYISERQRKLAAARGALARCLAREERAA